MPTIFIKMRPYLKEFILGLEGRDGNALYGPEPVQFPRKDKLSQLIDRMRRKPGPGCVPAKPVSRKDQANFLEVKFDPDPLVRFDELRTYLSPDAQAHIAKYIYNMFCATAYEFVNESLNAQKHDYPRETPKKNVAYREFCHEYKLMSADEDSIRKAFDRQARMFDVDSVKKKFEEKQNNRSFRAKNRAFQAYACATCG